METNNPIPTYEFWDGADFTSDTARIVQCHEEHNCVFEFTYDANSEPKYKFAIHFLKQENGIGGYLWPQVEHLTREQVFAAIRMSRHVVEVWEPEVIPTAMVRELQAYGARLSCGQYDRVLKEINS